MSGTTITTPTILGWIILVGYIGGMVAIVLAFLFGNYPDGLGYQRSSVEHLPVSKDGP